MRNINDTIGRLAALRARQSSPNTGQVHDRLSSLSDFGSNPGALRAWTYIPDGLPDAAPLVVVMHGCTQTAAGYDHGSGWSQLADREGFALLLPEQARANNANLCFNWFVPADTMRDAGEALSIRQMIETVVSSHGIDRKRIFVTGLSAGGAMASVMLATYPEVFAGGAIVAGLPFGSAKTIPEAFDRMRGHGGPVESVLQDRLRRASSHQGPWPTISVWHGMSDATVAVSNADAIIGQWRAVHGVADSPSRTKRAAAYTRRVWCDAGGRPVMESVQIVGMAHGTPLATTGDAGLGVAAPFMLDVGVSSTRHIAQFWGIARKGLGQTEAAKTIENRPPVKPAANGHEVATAGPNSAERPRILRAEAPEHRPVPPSNPADGVRKIIEAALRKAGLMR